MGSLLLRWGLVVRDKRVVGHNFEPKLVHSLRGCTCHEFPLMFVPTAGEAGKAQLCGRAVEGLAVLG